MSMEDIYAADRAYTQTAQPKTARVPQGAVQTRPDGTQYITLSSEGTTETATQLLNQGYREESPGTWVRYAQPEEVQPNADLYAADRSAEPVPQVSDVRRLAEAGAIGVSGADAYTRSALEQLPFGDEATAFLGGLVSGQGYTAARDQQALMADYDRQYNPAQRNLGGVAGFTAGLTVPVGRANNVRQALGLGAAVGGTYGFAQGDGSFAERLPGAGVGAVAGGTLGAGVQAAAPVVNNAVSGFAQRLGISGANRNATPQQQAATRLRTTMGGEDGALMAERQRLTGLGLSPSIADIAPQTTERLVRAAAGPAGEGSERAVANLAARQASLKPDVIRDVRSLSPVDQSADEFTQSLTQRRSNLAREEYAEPYSRSVSVPDEVRSILTDEPGRAAIRAARANAVELRDQQQVLDLDRLLAADAEGPLPEISAGTLDRIVQATRERASRFSERGLNARAAGAIQRRETIDAALDDVPGLDEARATYRGLSQQIDALDPRQALDIFEDPRDFARRVETMSEEARQAALVRVTQDLTDVLGGQRRAGTGTIDTAAQAPYAQENLKVLLGPDRAQRFIDTLSARVQQVQRAARQAPTTGSQTAGRLGDEQAMNLGEGLVAVSDFGQALGGNGMAAGRTAIRLIDRVRAAGLSPEVRAEIVEMGLGSADELERIIMLADEARAAGRPVPRVVRQFIDNSATRLGPAQADALRFALLPQRAAASEEEQPQ